jgi:hypothetical protein
VTSPSFQGLVPKTVELAVPPFAWFVIGLREVLEGLEEGQSSNSPGRRRVLLVKVLDFVLRML